MKIRQDCYHLEHVTLQRHDRVQNGSRDAAMRNFGFGWVSSAQCRSKK